MVMVVDHNILAMKVRPPLCLQRGHWRVPAGTRQNQKPENKIFIPSHSKHLQHLNPDNKIYGNTVLSPSVDGTQTLDFGPDNIKMKIQTKPRFICLHGFRTSAKIMQKQLEKWPESISEKLDLVFINAPYPAQGRSDVGGFFDPPFYEWFEYDKEYKHYKYFDECLAYIEDCMLKLGPFDGLLGFSQGAFLSAALPGLQSKGVILTNVPKIKFLIIIGGGKLLNPVVAEKAYVSPIECPSVHFVGQRDYMRPHGNKLLKCFVDPLVIRHSKGHIIPTLDENGMETMQVFLENIEKAQYIGSKLTY